ncbi:MAG: DnaT-like ssDNA-binding protein [Brevundimonas sp.]|uniref:DnaT-like ssDNA-binding protein n=1 Tax=Brevundimonas sp. TaxID=1871086 RepID=UPI00391A0AB7
MAGYGEDNGFEAWLTDNGLALPDGSLAVAVLRQRGSSYIDGLYGAKFSGVPTAGLAQDRAWPRSGACAFGQAIPDSVVPVAVVHASYAAAYQEAIKPGSLAVSATSSGALKRKKIDAIEKEYFEGSGDAVADNTLRLSAVEGLLAPFLRTPEVAVFVV